MEESEENRVLPATNKEWKHAWELFNFNKIKVTRKTFYMNIASDIAISASENEFYIRLLQQSGSKFQFLNEFLSFDRRLNLYAPLNAKERRRIFDTLSFPYLPMKSERDSTT